jgi:hypothetical protein
LFSIVIVHEALSRHKNIPDYVLKEIISNYEHKGLQSGAYSKEEKILREKGFLRNVWNFNFPSL